MNSNVATRTPLLPTYDSGGTKVQTNILWLHNSKARMFNQEPTEQRPSRQPKRILNRPERGRPDVVAPQVLKAMHAIWLDYCMKLFATRKEAGLTELLGKMELVGSVLTVVKSKNPSHVLLSGTVLDESKSMIYLQISDPSDCQRVVQVAKSDAQFSLSFGSQTFCLLGNAIDRPVTTRTKSKPKRIYSMLI